MRTSRIQAEKPRTTNPPTRRPGNVEAPAKQPSKKKQPHHKGQPGLGKLTSFGLSEAWHVALLLPKQWEDFTRVVKLFHARAAVEDGQWCVVRGHLAGNPQMKFDSGKPPRLAGEILDPNGVKIGYSKFGDTRDLEAALRGKGADEEVFLYGMAKHFSNRLWLQNIEIVPPAWIGRLRPVYPGKTKVINPETVRGRVFTQLRDAVPKAAAWLATQFQDFGTEQDLAALAGCPEWSLAEILQHAHLPKTAEIGLRAQEGLETLAGLGIIRNARKSQGAKTSDSKGYPLNPLLADNWKQRAKKIPFPLTGEQTQAVMDIVDDLTAPETMHRLLSGDVGTGKTAVYGLACAATIEAEGRAVVLLPNTTLAAQVAREFTSWWPDIPVQLITGESDQINPNAPLTVGTTAVLFRMKGHAPPDLLVVDEQQKFSREQRESLTGTATNLLEVSATCIPRSQALVRYGIVKISRLTKCHVHKKIHTRIWDKETRAGLFEKVKFTLQQGKQVLVVYPKRQDEDEKAARHSVEGAYLMWNKIFPGLVRLAHGGQSDEDKAAAIQDMREDKASILVATTVVEVGIDLPNLYHEIIVNPERHGLSGLHQLRGRVARRGGVGYCDLYLPEPISNDSMERLKVLTMTENGFEVAEHDMRLRGVGDLGQGSEKQSGADETFLFGRPVRVEVLDRILQHLENRNTICEPGMATR